MPIYAQFSSTPPGTSPCASFVYINSCIVYSASRMSEL